VRIIALANQKGGVGKTTSAINIGAGLCKLGKTALLVDIDPQAHATYSLGIELPAGSGKTVYELLTGKATLPELLAEHNGLKVLPADLDLAAAEQELAAVAGREFLLKEALDGLRGFDFVLIDCPPSLGLLTVNALVAAQAVFIPMQTEFLALRGLAKLLDTVEAVRKRLNRGLEVSGIIGTRFDSRKVLSREVVERLKGHFGGKLFETLIRENIALAEAPASGKTIFEYEPASHGAEDYLSLCKEILKRSGKV